MQGTVRTWDAASRAGSVWLDEGTPLLFDGPAVQVRSLRLGQRVALRVTDGQVVALTIATLPLR